MFTILGRLVIFFTWILLFTTQLVVAQHQGTISGVVRTDGEVLAGVNVGITDIQKGAVTNSEGEFLITDVEPGSYEIQFSSVGFETKKKHLTVKDGENTRLEILMEPMMEELSQIVVTGTMRETFVKDSPVKVNVISNRYLKKNPVNNLMESVSYINGLYKQVDCGVCSTSNIRINGMEGAYTAVLIDGMPIMGSLASVYGLNGLNTGIIESVEIIKGPNSTLYGSEAMGGVINVRTKEPDAVPNLSINAYMTTHSENNFDFTYAPELEGISTLFSGNGFYFDRFIDQNNDNFSDATKRKRVSLFNKWSFDRKDGRTNNVAWKYYYEDRIGGTAGYSRNLAGSENIYGEAIKTNRFELIGSYELPTEELLRIDYSYSNHDQDSYYGDYRYEANQQVYFTNLIWDKQFRYDKQLLLGAAFRYDALEQIFNNQYLDNGSSDNRFIPGVFAQYEQIFSSSIRGLTGLRIDHFEDHGFIFSPRMNLKFSAADHTTIRLNSGTGFRIVNLFTEEHEALSGSRQVVITENLNPERSYNATLNLNQIFDIGISVLNLDFDAFYTHFTNQIIPNYDVQNEIRYGNLDGFSVSRGISISAAHNFPGPLVYSMGVTFQDVYKENASGREDLLFAPGFNGVFSISYGLETIDTYVDYTGRITGKMKLPEYPGERTESETYTEQNIKVTKHIKHGIEVYASIQNIFNYTQEDPLIAPDRPFSDDFATDHVYGPIRGRYYLFGIQYTID